MRPVRRTSTLVAMNVPASHADLLDRPLPAALTTHFAEGRLQSTVVWFWRDGEAVCLTTMQEFVKARNLREQPLATLVVWDSDGRWLELRCAVARVEQSPAEALATCDDAGFRYCGVRPYFGAVVPAAWAEKEHPVTFRFTPRVVTAGTVAEPAPGALPDERALPRSDDEWIATGSHPEPADGEPTVPADHLDLITGPAVRWLATHAQDGHARVQPVATALVVGGGRDPGRVVVRPTKEQTDDLALDPRATLLVVDRHDTVRWVELRADAHPLGDGTFALVGRRLMVDAIHP